MKSKKINYGKADMLEKDEFAVGNVKERVTIYFDEDIIDWARSEGKKLGLGYQTFLNMKLRVAKEGSIFNKNEIKAALEELFDDGKLVLRSKQGHTLRKGDGVSRKKAAK